MEKILDERVASYFSPLIEKFHDKFKKGKTSKDFHQKFGWLMEKKQITLGKWVRIIEDFRKQDPDLEEFRLCLKTNFDNNDLEIIQRTCQSIVDVRNKIAHSEILTIKQVKKYRKNFIPLINKTIDILY